jgi:hypothetical protein
LRTLNAFPSQVSAGLLAPNPGTSCRCRPLLGPRSGLDEGGQNSYALALARGDALTLIGERELHLDEAHEAQVRVFDLAP